MPVSSFGSDDPEMHKRVDFMVAADPLVLEFLYNSRNRQGEPSVQTPNTIHLNTGYSRQHVSERCRVLADHDLVDQVGSGRYRLTERGELLLENEIAPEELNENGDES